VTLRWWCATCSLIPLALGTELLTAAPASSGPPSAFAIQWTARPASGGVTNYGVTITGVTERALRALQQSNWTVAQWQRLLRIEAEPEDGLSHLGQPAMLGSYRADSAGIHFQPQFPLLPRLTYRASFSPFQLPGGTPAPIVTSTFKLPARPPGPPTVVRQIHPSADILPENLLKFYLHFSAPMSGGHIYDHIHLRDQTGRAVDLPFLEIDEELWDPAMTRLTLFIDPGRIKREVKPLEDVGPALEKGKRYTLTIDTNWLDADARPLQAAFTKAFQVGPAWRTPIDVAQWKLAAPAAGSKDALSVRFPVPLDHALAQRLMWVVRGSGERVAGTIALADEERQWTFVPAQAWSGGAHRVAVQNNIEDLAGNNIGKAFEVDLFESVQPRLSNAVTYLEFGVR